MTEGGIFAFPLRGKSQIHNNPGVMYSRGGIQSARGFDSHPKMNPEMVALRPQISRASDMRPGIHKMGKGEVVTNSSGHRFSKKPQTPLIAHAQLRAIEAHIHNPSLGKSTRPGKSK